MSSHEKGLVMSSAQLNDLWNFEFKLAHELLGFPLRTCSAIPSEWGTPMKDEEFNSLRIAIHRMWLRASLLFSGFNCETQGWGLKVNEHSEKSTLSISSNSFTVMGWIAVAPPISACPTGHRYLRSPLEDDLYLGGPISLANWSEKPSVKCNRATSNKPLVKFMTYVQTLRTVGTGTEITWSYGQSGRPNLCPKEEWFLDDCCRERCPRKLSSGLNKTNSVEKRRRVRIVAPYRPCVYCGENLETLDNTPLKGVSKRHMKPHLALKHSVQLCLDAGLQVDDEAGGVTLKAFLSQLHLMSRVIGKLEDHNYIVKPACTYFLAMGQTPPADNIDSTACLGQFLREAREAFSKYRVVYLRGISIPTSLEDLKPVGYSDYRDIVWEGGKRPRSNTFSVENILTDDEKETLEMEVKVNVEQIIEEYSRVFVVVDV